MRTPRKTPAFVALAAAYAVVLQTVLLAICGSMAEGQAFGAASLCASTQSGERHPAPIGHGDDCLSACLACGCGIAVTPMQAAARAELPAPMHRILAAAALTVAASLRVDPAHRSRGPPRT